MSSGDDGWSVVGGEERRSLERYIGPTAGREAPVPTSAGNATTPAATAAAAAAAAAAAGIGTATTLSNLEASASASTSLSILRVSQLEAQVLDAELKDLLRHQLLSVLAHLSGGDADFFAQEHAPEIDLCLNALFHAFSLGVVALGLTSGSQDASTPGQKLENLRYRNERLYEAAPEA